MILAPRPRFRASGRPQGPRLSAVPAGISHDGFPGFWDYWVLGFLGSPSRSQGNSARGSGQGVPGKGFRARGSGQGVPGKGFRARGSGQGVPGKGFRARGSGQGVPGKGFRARGSGQGVPGKGFRARGSGQGVPGKGFRARGSGQGVPGKGFRARGSGQGVPGKEFRRKHSSVPVSDVPTPLGIPARLFRARLRVGRQAGKPAPGQSPPRFAPRTICDNMLHLFPQPTLATEELV